MMPDTGASGESNAPKKRRRRRRSSARRRAAALAIETAAAAPAPAAAGFLERHRTTAIVILAGSAFLGVGGLSFASWWYADVTDFKLEEASCAQAQQSFPIDTRCHMVAHDRRTPQAVSVSLDLAYDRNPAGWYPTFEKIPSTGSSSVHVSVLVPIHDGQLSSLSRPLLGVPGVERNIGLADPEPYWARLEGEPANAAYDAMVNRAYIPFGSTIIYLSGLRRLEMWEAAIEVLSVGQMEQFNEEMPAIWSRRLAIELDYVGKAELDQTDRLRYNKFLADLKRHPGWQSVLRELKSIQATRAGGRVSSGEERASRRESMKGAS